MQRVWSSCLLFYKEERVGLRKNVDSTVLRFESDRHVVPLSVPGPSVVHTEPHKLYQAGAKRYMQGDHKEKKALSSLCHSAMSKQLSKNSYFHSLR